MHANICEFPSETLYSSKLISHESVASHLLDDLPNTFLDSEDAKEVLQTPIVFFDTSGCEYYERVDSTDGDEGSRCNENEATIVSNWVDKLVSVIFGIHLSKAESLQFEDHLWCFIIPDSGHYSVRIPRNRSHLER